LAGFFGDQTTLSPGGYPFSRQVGMFHICS
jgi:hypothetical protein